MTPQEKNEFIGSYKILHKMAEGGMALIYKAVQPSLKRNVVIKKIKDPNREIINRFKKEALLTASFHHENLASIYDFIYSHRSYHLVMEYIDGEDLRTIIDYMSPLPPAIVALITLGIARGLEYTHARNIIHRDIKPGNILISYDGEVKLIDFGVARDDVSTRLTMTGMIVGTPSYMSPEQANGDPLSAQSDLFSLGILIYEMLTGIKPFHGENNTEVLARIVRNRYVPPERINPDIPAALRRVVRKTLRKQAARRYSSATELIHDLESFLSWQERSRKKEVLARFLDKLDKNAPASSEDTLQAAIFASLPSKYWRWMNGLLIGAALFLVVLAGRQFFVLNTGYLSVSSNRTPFSLVLDEDREYDFNDSRVTLGPLRSGWHSLQAGNSTDAAMFISGSRIRPSDTSRVDFRFVPAAGRAPVRINTTPDGAAVTIDAHPVGRTPLDSLMLSRGRHRLSLSKEGYQPLTQDFRLDGGRSYQIHFELEPAGATEQ